MWNNEHPLYPYQERAARTMCESDVLLAFEMGTGKTPTTLWALEELRGVEFSGPGTVVVPASLKWQWQREIEKFTDQTAVVIDGSAKQRQEQYLTVRPTGAGYLIMSYDTFVRDWAQHSALARGFLVLDECFPDNTPVDTPDGPRPIQDIKVGDIVMGANGPSMVRRTVSRLAASMVKVVFEDGSDIICTPNHRFFTSVGWEEARMMTHGTEVIRTTEAMRVVRDAGREYDDHATFLWDILLSEMEDVPTRDQGATVHRRGEAKAVGEEPVMARIPDTQGTVGAVVDSKGWMDRRIGGEVPLHLDGQREHHQGPSRQRESAHSTGAVAAGRFGGGLAVELPHLAGSEEGRVSDALQGGPGTAGTSAGGGGGRELASVEAGPGREEGFSPEFLRVDRVEVLQPGHPDFDRLCLVPDRIRVHNLEVQGHPSYSVNGLLVHNCTAIKNYTSKRSQHIKKYRNVYTVKVALTGTPIENGKAEEIFSIMEFVDPKVLGKFWDFEKKFVRRNPMGWIEGYRNLGEFHKTIKPYVLRATHKEPEVAKYLPHVMERDPILVPLDKKTSNTVHWITSALLKDLDSIAADLSNFDWDNPRPDHPDGKLMAKIQVLRMLLDHPQAVSVSAFQHQNNNGGSAFADEVEREGLLKGLGSPKMDALEQYVKDFLDVDPKNKVVVFSSFVVPASFIHNKFDGSVLFHGGLTPKQRDAAKQKFASDPQCRVFVSTDAGGYGLDLPEANLLINFDMPWQAGMLKQRSARIKRASSEWEYVIIQDFLVENTIEERMREMLLHKIAVSDAIVDGEGITEGGGVASDLDSLRSFLTDLMGNGLINAS